jgi:predicted ABC-type sugar transport system permease subunit
VVITAYYWAQLYERGDAILTNVLSHALPLFALLVEYSMVATPFIARHSLFTVIFGIAYMITNLITTFVKEPPYGALSWDSPFSIGLACALFFALLLIHLAMVKVSRWKLSKFGLNYDDLLLKK